MSNQGFEKISKVIQSIHLIKLELRDSDVEDFRLSLLLDVIEIELKNCSSKIERDGMKYDVYISKDYLPKEIQKQKRDYIWELVKIEAPTRQEAAQLVWKQKGQEWLSQMDPMKTNKVLLYVNEPRTGIVGSKLSPIRVNLDEEI